MKSKIHEYKNSKMSKKISILFIASVIAFSSCTKVIDLKLNSQNPQIVVEGNITNEAGPYTVKLTKTIDFSQPNVFPTVNDAIVKISDGTITETLIETSPGIYQTSMLVGTPGKTYSLNIQADGKTITSQATMPAIVPLDSIVFIEDQFVVGGNEPEFLVVPRYLDPITPGNNYRFVLTINDTLDKTFVAYNDDLTNGLQSQRPYFSQDAIMNLGDTVQMEMQCIDVPMYNYYLGINSNSQTTPANPTNNLTGDALGYFSVHTVSRKSARIK
jgi:hypothetical protein